MRNLQAAPLSCQNIKGKRGKAMRGYTIDEMQIGQTASFGKTITETDSYLYAAVTGDMNPAHTNHEYAKNTVFKERIAHGMISGGLISTVLGMHLPGPGCIYISQTLKFLAPVRFGDTITATAEVIEKNVEKNRVVLKTSCVNQDGKIVTEGEAVIMPSKA